MKKLVLNVETLRNLQNAELSQVAGGDPQHGIGNNKAYNKYKETIKLCHLPIPPTIVCVEPQPLVDLL
ncbi:MAG: class I lanthipeptide [Phycisphaerae bacterium]|nr:class I lanthipeptide [Phycisphaerae bacterium]